MPYDYCRGLADRSRGPVSKPGGDLERSTRCYEGIGVADKFEGNAGCSRRAGFVFSKRFREAWYRVRQANRTVFDLVSDASVSSDPSRPSAIDAAPVCTLAWNASRKDIRYVWEPVLHTLPFAKYRLYAGTRSQLLFQAVSRNRSLRIREATIVED